MSPCQISRRRKARVRIGLAKPAPSPGATAGHAPDRHCLTKHRVPKVIIVISRLCLQPAGLLLAVLATGCASTGAVPHPFPTPSPPAPDSPQSVPDLRFPLDGYLIAGAALQLRGTPYRLGGADPRNGFDCSGLVQYVYSQHGIAVPRDVRSQYLATQKIDDDDIQPGDLLFFATEGPQVSHVAIAISSDQFVHAPTTNGVIRVEMRKSDYWSPKYLGARRVGALRQTRD